MLPGRRRVFVPMTRVTSVDGGQVITTGLVNMRRFEQRPNETLVLAELIERHVRVRDEQGELVDATVEDIGLEQNHARSWSVTRVFVRRTTPRGSSIPRLGRRRGETFVVDGRKLWTSSAQLADWIYLAVRTDPDAPRHRGLSVLVAPMDTPGIEVRPFPTLGGGVLCEVFLDRVEIPADLNVTPEYPLAVTTEAPNADGAVAFTEFVLGDAGRDILAGYGFSAP